VRASPAAQGNWLAIFEVPRLVRERPRPLPAFSPHDLRHRRASLLHLGGVPWARIGEHVGQRYLAVTANTCTHVLVDEAELDYSGLLA
jgi:integrase